MGPIFYLFFFLLFKEASPLKGTAQVSSCSSKFKENQHQLNSSGIHLTIHDAHGPCSPLGGRPLSPAEVLKHDQLRVQALNDRVLAKSSTSSSSLRPKSGSFSPESIGIPLKPGESIGVGNYVVQLGLGSPVRYFIVVVDTGSSFSWVQCQPCKGYCHPQSGPTFDPSGSRTYKRISCRSVECSVLEEATLNPPGCSPSNTCIYEASYGDGSYSVGFLSRDALTVGKAQSMPGFIYGCGQENRGLFGRSAGLIGLARNKLSLLGQLSSKYGYVFSYCLPTSTSSGTLSIGHSSYNPSSFVFTRMYTDQRDATLYFLRLVRITVSGKAIRAPAATYASTPTIIDSGTVITRLPPDVYTALQKAFTAAMGGYTRAPPYSILDTCYHGSPSALSVPAVSLVFEGGSALRLTVQNVLYEVTDGVSCLAFASNGDADGIAIIGNRQQQTFKVVYDVTNSKIGFAAGGCS